MDARLRLRLLRSYERRGGGDIYWRLMMVLSGANDWVNFGKGNKPITRIIQRVQYRYIKLSEWKK